MGNIAIYQEGYTDGYDTKRERDKIKSEDFIKAFGSGSGSKEQEHHLITENKGDLISREALKKALKSNCTPELCHDYNTSWCERCCRTNDFEDLIDNAPTVESPKWEEC